LISSITDITGDLVVDAPGMTSLDLPALTSDGGDLRIFYNVALCNSLAIALRDQLIAAGWNGTSNIYNNDNSC